MKGDKVRSVSMDSSGRIHIEMVKPLSLDDVQFPRPLWTSGPTIDIESEVTTVHYKAQS